MKKLLLLPLCLWLTLSAESAERQLLFTAQRVEAALKRMKTDSVQAAAYTDILAEADRQLVKGDVRRLEYPALAYQMTGERRYADKIKEVLQQTALTATWQDAEMMQRNPPWRSELQMAHRCFQVAVAYDAIRPTLTATERYEIAEGFWRLAIEPLLGDWLLDPTRIHSLNSMGHNWWTACVGMGALLALSMEQDLPPAAAQAARKAVEALPQWFNFAGDDFQHKPRNFDPQAGGMYESINYASFGIGEALLLRLAYKNAHPEVKQADIPQIKDITRFFCQVCYPRNGQLWSINFGDSHKWVCGQRGVLLAAALEGETPLARWYDQHIVPGQHNEAFPRNTPMGFLYPLSQAAGPDTPNLPTSTVWHDFGWATLRNNWKNDETMLAVKSGMTWNHAHADANSFILFHKGVDIIKDAGNCSYGKREYRQYFFQSEAHNVVKVNGKGQPTEQQYHGSPLPGRLSNLLDEGDVKFVLADGTGPMSWLLSRNLRSFLWMDNVIYITDDLKAHEPSQFEWLWHPGGTASKRGGDLQISSGNSAVVVRPLFPQPLAPSDYVHDYPEHLYWTIEHRPTESMDSTEEVYSFHLPQTTDRVKALTAIILKETPDQKALPTIERRQGKDWIGLRITSPQGMVTDLYINQLADGRLMHLNSWIDADGWTTDAYILAVSYPKGATPSQAKRKTIIYGSSLRRGTNVLFSSLEKQSLVIRK